MFELGKLGTTTDSAGNSEYRPWKNPLLQQGVLGMNPGGFGATPMNPGTFATGPAASAIAKALEGVIVDDPQSQNWNTTARVLAVQLGDGDPVNAGAICSILGNDVAYGSPRMKAWEICGLFGLPFDVAIADTLYHAVMTDGK